MAIFLPLALLALGVALLARPRTDAGAAREAETNQRHATRRDTLRPKPFDPNTVTYEQLREMGLTQTEAASLVRYRSYDKIFRIPEDVAACYGIDDSLYRVLKPHIRIARRYTTAPQGYRPGRMVAEPLPPEQFRIDTVSARYLEAIGALTRQQARTFVKWRDTHPICDMAELVADGEGDEAQGHLGDEVQGGHLLGGVKAQREQIQRADAVGAEQEAADQVGGDGGKVELFGQPGQQQAAHQGQGELDQNLHNGTSKV